LGKFGIPEKGNLRPSKRILVKEKAPRKKKAFLKAWELIIK